MSKLSYLEVKNISIELGEFKLKDINLKVKKGDYLTIIGPTGSGKSILLETIAGFYKPKLGKIYLAGEDITNLPPEKRKMSIVYQDYMLFPHMTAFENIAYGLKKKIKSKEEIEKRIKEICEILNITHILKRNVKTLSGGEQQRVALARALVIEPEVLLLDEPFSALDVKTKENLRNLVKKAVKEYGTTVIHITHDFEDVWSLADRVAVMKGGCILQEGSVEEIFYKPSVNFVAEFVGTNVLKGEVIGKDENGLTLIKVGDTVVKSVDMGDGDVLISIRPEDVVVFYGEKRCKVKNIRRRGEVVEITLDLGGETLRSLLTPNMLKTLNVEDEVSISVDPNSVRIIKSLKQKISYKN
ncbi:ABC transporter ATP-binding protein [Methanocaldococcus sp.]